MMEKKLKICFDRILTEEQQKFANSRATEYRGNNNAPIDEEDLIDWNRPVFLLLVNNTKWPNGQVLRVRFLDGVPDVQEKVKSYMKKWEQYVNIRFNFVNDRDAEIRISFQQEGSWSYIGLENLGITNPNEPTMNYGWLTSESSEEEFARVVLHETGHALGFPHEQASPNATFEWDREAVIADYSGPPNYWSIEDIERNVLFRYNPRDVTATEFDPYSIMLYPIPNRHTQGDFEIPWRNKELSQKDIELASRIYPKSRNVLRPTGMPIPQGERAADPSDQPL